MITDELRTRFLARFTDVARARLQRARSATSDAVIAAELHALAGEAATLGLGPLAALVRQIVEAVRRGEDADSRPAQLDEIEAKLAPQRPG